MTPFQYQVGRDRLARLREIRREQFAVACYARSNFLIDAMQSIRDAHKTQQCPPLEVPVANGGD